MAESDLSCNGDQLRPVEVVGIEYEVPEPINSIASTSNGRFFAVSVSNKVYTFEVKVVQGKNEFEKNMTYSKVEDFKEVPLTKDLEQLPPIKQIECSNNQVVLLSTQGFVYCIDWPQQFKPKMGQREIKMINKLTNIVEIHSTFTHTLALRRVESGCFADWDSERMG